MKRSSSLASPLYPKIRFAFTGQPITVWLAPFYCGSPSNPLTKRSNNQIPVSLETIRRNGGTPRIQDIRGLIHPSCRSLNPDPSDFPLLNPPATPMGPS